MIVRGCIGAGLAALVLAAGLSAPALAESTAPIPDAGSTAPNQPAVAPVPADGMDGEAPVSDSAPPLPSADLVKQFYQVCTDLASGDAAAFDRAAADGWVRYEDDVASQYKTIFSASKALAGFAQVELWSSVETYPSRRLGYCRIDLGDYDQHIAFDDFAAIAGLTGSVKTEGEDAYGAWETADHAIMVIADRVGGEFEVEFNLVSPAAGN